MSTRMLPVLREMYIAELFLLLVHVTGSPSRHLTSSPFNPQSSKGRTQTTTTTSHESGDVLTAECPEMCNCTSTFANCSGTHLTYVPTLPNDITVLIFSLNNLTSIQNANFFSNVTNITGLDLSYNGLTFVCNGTFMALTRLKTFNLDHNEISREILSLVLSIDSLEALSLNNTHLGKWANEVFDSHPLPNLKNITLYNNDVRMLNFTAFAQYETLRHMGVGNSSISEIVANNMSSLEYLDLNNNGIFLFPRTCQSGNSFFPKLMTLFLNENDVHDIDNVCLPNLVTLSLSYNRFDRIKSYVFGDQNFPKLNTLIMEGPIGTKNNLHIEKNAFSNSNLQVISLVRCYSSIFNDSRVHPDAFVNCSSLETLQLDENFFIGITDSKFKKLFGRLPALRKLHMGYGYLTTITENTFKCLRFVEELYLYGNILMNIPDGAFDNMDNLTILYLDNNKISSIRETTFSSATRQRLHKLILASNPIVCSCDIKWFQEWYLSNHSLFYDSYITYDCSNLIKTSLADFYLPDQACLLNSDILILTVVSVSLVLITLTVTAVFYRLRWHIRLLLYEAFRGRTKERWQQYLCHGNFPYDVFVSYAAEDLDWVLEHLIPELEERMGLRLCIHHRDFLPGKNIVDNIAENLKKSKKVMLVFSTHFARSQWCQFELAQCLRHVMDHDDILVIICLGHVPNRLMTGAMLALLKVTTYIPWSNDSDARASFWGRLKIALNEILPLS